ncbi:hypothetical protein QE152_g32510 [Popillia japonica]|uniref:Uncharacterized protein n=1 Tax=Popillia japonica TaxID=7064 RepID=A0AAW1IYS0_POPJA
MIKTRDTTELTYSKKINKPMNSVQGKPTKTQNDKNTGHNRTDLFQKKILQEKTVQNHNNLQNVQYSGTVKRNSQFNSPHRSESALTIDKSEANSSNDDQFKVVERKKKRTNLTTISGTATNIELKGSIRYAHLHLSGLDPNTTVNNIENYLKNKGVVNPRCLKIDAKRPEEYASFKVSVPVESLETAKKPELWPSGARISPFLERLFQKAKRT